MALERLECLSKSLKRRRMSSWVFPFQPTSYKQGITIFRDSDSAIAGTPESVIEEPKGIAWPAFSSASCPSHCQYLPSISFFGSSCLTPLLHDTEAESLSYVDTEQFRLMQTNEQ